MSAMRLRIGLVAVLAVFLLTAVVWLAGSSNPFTPAGYVGYLTRGALMGKSRFYGIQKGPTSAGRTWLLSVQNVSVTPYTYSEDFSGQDVVLAKDNLSIAFRVHLVFRIREDRVQDFFEKYSYVGSGKTADGNAQDSPDEVFKVAYGNYVKEPLRTFARDEVQKHKGLEVKDHIVSIGESISNRIREVTKDTPFEVSSVVVGNIQYPGEVTSAVSRKMAATQELERKQTEIEIEEKERQKRVIQARGIAESMEIIRQQLTSQYLQHEAIEAQKAMVNSPNNTVVYIPVGPMGVPIVGTFDATQRKAPAPANAGGGKN